MTEVYLAKKKSIVFKSKSNKRNTFILLNFFFIYTYTLGKNKPIYIIWDIIDKKVTQTIK